MRIISTPPAANASLKNPLPIDVSVSVTDGQHILKLQKTYTVPANKIATLFSAHISISQTQDVAVTTPCRAYVALHLNGQAEVIILLDRLGSSVYGGIATAHLGGPFILREADKIKIYTEALDTASAFLQTISCFVIESDP